jgi:hypothetical protein
VGGKVADYSSQRVNEKEDNADNDNKDDRDVKDATKAFLVHETLFRSQSPFFEAALGKEWKEAEERVVKLPEHAPKAFEVYLRWVYSHRIRLSLPTNTNQETIETFGVLCRAYVLGDVLRDYDFKDAIVDAITHFYQLAGWRLPTEHSAYIYENTPPEAKIRRVLVFLAVGVNGELEASIHKKECRKFTNVDFLSDVVEQMSKRLDADQYSDINPLEAGWRACQYHEHGTANDCYKIKYGDQPREER